MKNAIRCIIFVLVVSMLCACQPANLAMEGSGYKTQPKSSDRITTVPASQTQPTVMPTQAATVPTHPTEPVPVPTHPAEPILQPEEPLTFAYKYIGWGKLENGNPVMPGEYAVIIIRSPQEAAAYGCPADSVYVESDFYEKSSLIIVDFVEPTWQVEFAATNFAEKADGSYHLSIDKYYNDPGSEVVRYRTICIEVNRVLSDEHDIEVVVTSVLVDRPIK